MLLERGEGGAEANPSQRAYGDAAVHRHGQGFSHGSLTVWSGETEERCTKVEQKTSECVEGEGSEENGPDAVVGKAGAAQSGTGWSGKARMGAKVVQRSLGQLQKPRHGRKRTGKQQDCPQLSTCSTTLS